ncbi:MAG TPA: arsenate reductase ArsC [Actinomycetes bacterium]|jgi:protein-tyrosine-phosphatase|nr:arsenate reductase ArsC [Actinomycetes bacterium]
MARRGEREPRAGQSARLRLLPGAGQPAEERARPLVVFLGVGDDRRSRLAAALLAFRARGAVQAVSMSPASSDPDPVVVRAFADIGVDLLAWRSWPHSTEMLERASVVVVMGYDEGALEGCSARAEDWFIDDPCGKDAETVRHLRDAIDRRVQRLLVRLGGAGPSSIPTARRS